MYFEQKDEVASLVNRDFFVNELELNTSNSKSVIFQKDNIIVLSPSVQNERLGFDIHLNTIDKLKLDSNLEIILIVRYFKDKFLVANFKDFQSKILLNDIKHTYSDGKQKWGLKVHEDNGKYYINVIGHKDYTYPIESYSKSQLKNYLEEGKYLETSNSERINTSDDKRLINQSVNVDLTYHIHTYLQSKGFRYSLENIKNLYLSIRSKPFVIISGISGTGKTKVVQLFAESLGATEGNGRFKLIPVRPDWSDSSELLGYVDLKGDFKKGPLTEMIEHAVEHSELPHFVLLDEMNLARVEYYFSDVLSVMESRKREGENITSSLLVSYQEDGQERKIYLPNNLYIIGTVNMDETTHPFSKKVLDRANTIEFNEIYLEDFSFLTDLETKESICISNNQLEASYLNVKDVYQKHEALVQRVSSDLSKINQHLQHIKAEVGYRVRDEICFYMAWNEQEAEPLLDEDSAFDFCIMQKVLPRILGSGKHVEVTLQGLFQHFTETSYELGMNMSNVSTKYPKSVKKIADMLEGFYDVGFTSFWNA